MWNPRLISEDVGVGFNVRKLRRYFLRYTVISLHSYMVIHTIYIFLSSAVSNSLTLLKFLFFTSISACLAPPVFVLIQPFPFPFVMQHFYDGLLNEAYGIRCCI